MGQCDSLLEGRPHQVPHQVVSDESSEERRSEKGPFRHSGPSLGLELTAFPRNWAGPSGARLRLRK